MPPYMHPQVCNVKKEIRRLNKWEMIDLLKSIKIDWKASKKTEDPGTEPKMLKPAPRTGFSELNLRTGRDSNPRPPP